MKIGAGYTCHCSVTCAHTVDWALVCFLGGRSGMQRRGKLWVPALTLSLALAGGQTAFALTKEAAQENCRATVGRPIVQACMGGGGGSREACREQASPKVRACVIAA